MEHGVSTASALGMALTALWMVLTPGPNMIYLVSRSISQGRGAGLISLAGTGVGFLIYMVLANFGLSVILVSVPWVYLALKIAGIGYLLWLAFNALRPGGTGVFETKSLKRHSPLALFRMGLLTNLLNPKAAVMYLALIPQFVDPESANPLMQGFILGGIQISVSMIVNAVIVILAGSIAGWLNSRPTWLRIQRKVTGTMLAGMAVLIAFEAPKSN